MASLNILKDQFLAYVEQEKFNQEPKELYEPNNYFLSIGGKRLRPLLLLLANQLFSGDTRKVLPAALAIEYFHNFTLIHDDVMDNADVRRGFVTVHNKYDLNTAILSGDVLLIYAYRYLSMVDKKYLSEVMDIFNRTATEVCEGQQMDLNFEKQETVSEEAYIEMIRLKTAVLLAASMQVGAILAGANTSDAEFLYRFAHSLGIAFQIQDDLLDSFGDAEKVGKKTGGDIIQNKKTILAIKAFEFAGKNNDKQFQTAWNEKDDKIKVDKIKAYFESSGARTYTENLRDHFVETAMENLKNIHLEEDKKAILRSLAENLVYRNY